MDSPVEPRNDKETGGVTGGSTPTSVILPDMLAWLPPLFFFAVLMGSPVPGFLVFMLIGVAHAWQNWRQPHSANAFQWTRQDTWLALCFMSIPLFKATTVTWAEAPVMAWKNALQHSYFLFWPLVLLGLDSCRAQQDKVDRAIALGLLAYSVFAVGMQMRGTPISEMGGARQNPGIVAQMIMVVGTWNLLALTRPGLQNKVWQATFALAYISSYLVLVLTTRRLELLGFALLSAAVLVFRFKAHLTWLRAALALTGFVMIIGLLVYLRWDKFALGFEQIAQYRIHGANTAGFTTNSWGIRLELWRVGLAAFMDHPWLGISAGARPFTMQAWGAPPPELFGHNHFHSHLIQILVEGGLLGLLVLSVSLIYSTRHMILVPLKTRPEAALLAAAVLGAYTLEGLASAALHYDKANALLVICSAWCWVQTRKTRRLSA